MKREGVITDRELGHFIRECNKNKKDQGKRINGTNATNGRSSRRKLVGFMARYNTRESRRSDGYRCRI